VVVCNELMDAATQQRLCDTQAGGKLVLLPICRNTTGFPPCTLLADTLGIRRRSSASNRLYLDTSKTFRFRSRSERSPAAAPGRSRAIVDGKGWE
jgi:hypothetical protein